MFDGVRAFTEGWRLLTARGIAALVWWPVLVSLVVVGGGLYVALGQAGRLSDWLVSLLPELLAFLEWVIAPLLYLLTVLISAWLFSFLAVLIASPFSGELSARTELLRFGARPDSALGIGAALVASARREARKLRYHLPRLVALLLLGFVPLVNVFAPLAWVLFGGWMMAVQFLDYATENRDAPFEATLARARRHRAATLGFGACTTVAMSIPLLNFLAVPAAVIGATLLWRKIAEDA